MIPFLLHSRWVVFGIALTLVILLTTAFWQYTQDDVFITYTYSRNIAQGVGFVFNAGERVQGTTTPLWALAMAGAYRLSPDLLHAGNFLSSVLLAAMSVLAYLLVRRYFSSYTALAATTLVATSPLNYASFGMETMLYCALLFAAFWLWGTKRRALALVAAAALTWTRADGVVLGAALCLLTLLDDKPLLRRFLSAARLGIIYMAGIAPWFLFAWWYFGTPLPNTFGAKQEFLQGLKFIADGVERWSTFFGSNPLSLFALVFIPIGMWQAWQRASLRPLPVWTLLYGLGYTALNVTNFWYYTPLVNGLILLAMIGAEAAVRYGIQRAGRRQTWVTGALALLGAAILLNMNRALQLSPPPPRLSTYRLAGEWIAEHTPEDATLLVADLGIVGYYAQRYTLDSFGLIVPDMIFKTPEYATLKYKPDYVLATQYFLWRYTDEAWFRSLYESVVQFSTAGDAEFSPVTLYHRRGALTAPDAALEGTTLPLSVKLSLSEGEPLPIETRAFLEMNGQPTTEVAQPFLFGRYPASAVPSDEVLIEQALLPLPTAPGVYHWMVTAPVEISGTVEVIPLSASPNYVAVGAEWGNFVSLDGVLPLNGEAWSGGSLSLLLDWRSLAAVERDYTVFVHLLNADGILVAQHDGMPARWGRPTQRWLAGERVVDEHEIVLPPDLPSGEYRLRVGWYEWLTQERVLLVNGEDALDLPLRVLNRFPGGSGLP